MTLRQRFRRTPQEWPAPGKAPPQSHHLPFHLQAPKWGLFLWRYIIKFITITAALVASSFGCQAVKSLDGTESTTLNPVEARIEADRYRRQAEHLEHVADMSEGLLRSAWDGATELVSSNPTLAALLGPAGLLGGLLLPTPGQRRREADAMAKGIDAMAKGAK